MKALKERQYRIVEVTSDVDGTLCYRVEYLGKTIFGKPKWKCQYMENNPWYVSQAVFSTREKAQHFINKIREVITEKVV